MRGIQRARWVVGAATFAMIATACGGSDGGGGSSAGQTASGAATGGGASAGGGAISVEVGEPQHLSPPQVAETSGSLVLSSVYSGLIDYDTETSQPENVMADSIEPKTPGDFRTWVIKIKPGWKFHNGEDVTAQSYADSWNWTANAENAQENQGFFQRFQGFDAEKPVKALPGVKVVDPTTLEVTLTQPFSSFPVTLGYTAFYPLPKAFFADPKKFEDSPIGNGPYQMDGNWVHNQEIKVKKYADFKGTPGKVDNLTFKIYESPDTAYNDLRAGNLDIIPDTLPASAIATAPQELGERYIEKESSTIQFLGYPIAQNPAFRNPMVRKAISMSIDRDTITKTIFNGTRVPAKSYVSDVVEGAREDPCGEACTYNPERAKQMLQQAGGLPGNKMEIGYNADGGHKDWVEAAANNIRTGLGVEVTTKPFQQFAQLLNDLGDKKYNGVFRLGWSFDYPLIENYLTPIFGTASIENGSNYTGYSNPRFDQLITQGDRAATREQAIQTYQQAEDVVLADLPNIPLWFAKTTAAHSENVSNVKIDAFNRVDWTQVEAVRR